MTEHRGGSGNFADDKEKASEAGKKGGQNSGGNFKNDREKASEAGKKGGQNSHRDSCCAVTQSKECLGAGTAPSSTG